MSSPSAAVDPLGRLTRLEGVGSAFAATRDGIDALLRDRGLRSTHPEDTGESLLRGARASAVLAGSASSLADVRRGAADVTARSAVRLSTELLGLVPTLASSPLQALARLHTLAATGHTVEEDLGRPRDDAAADRLRALSVVLSTPTAAPALVVAAVAHAEVAAGEPFVNDNGLVARALERLLLVVRGVDAKSLVVPEAGHLALRPAYEARLRGYRDDGTAGVQAWLLYAAEAYAAGAEASPLARP